MKLAALSPRIISFNREEPQRSAAGVAVHVRSAHVADAYHENRPFRLTPRELEVLARLCEGLSNKHISRLLNISAGTVKIHVGKILSELGVASRLQAVVAAHRKGLVRNAPVKSHREACGSGSSERGFAPQSYELRPLQAA